MNAMSIFSFTLLLYTKYRFNTIIIYLKDVALTSLLTQINDI